MTQTSRFKYLVEGIGFNSGEPFIEHATNNLDEAHSVLYYKTIAHPRIAHRLVEVIKRVEASR